MAQKQSRVGFGRGFVAPFGAIGGIVREPRAWPYALVPALVFLLLELGVVLASWRLLKPWVNARLGGGAGWQDFGAALAAWLSVLLVAALGWVLAALLTPALSAPALERLVGLVERELGVTPRAPLGFVEELGCGLRATLSSLAITLPLVLGLTLLELLVPPLSALTTPLKLLVGALGVAWGLFDYPLTLRGVGVRERWGFVSRHFAAVLGFGLAFSLVFWLPCFGILMLPVGVVAATRLYWEIERAGAARARTGSFTSSS